MIRVAIARLLALSAIIGEKGEKEWVFDLRVARVLVRKRRKRVVDAGHDGGIYRCI